MSVIDVLRVLAVVRDGGEEYGEDYTRNQSMERVCQRIDFLCSRTSAAEAKGKE